MRTALLALALAACHGGDDTDGGNGAYGALPDADVSIVSEGDGPTNDEPLEPMITGMLGRTANGESVLRWTGAVDAGRDEVAVLEVNGTTYGHGTGLFRHTRDGVVTHGLDMHLDPDALPVLLVPDEVRPGMTWDSAYTTDGDVVNRQVVVARATATLPIGPTRVWGIGEYQGESLVSVRWYGEGVGRVESSPDAETQWNPEIAYRAMVVPLEPQATAELALDPVAISAVLDPFGRPVRAADYPSGLRAVDRDGSTIVAWYGFLPAQCPYCSDAWTVTCRDLGGGAAIVTDGCRANPDWSSIREGDFDFVLTWRPSAQGLVQDALAARGFEEGALFAWSQGGASRYLLLSAEGGVAIGEGAATGMRTPLVDATPHRVLFGVSGALTDLAFVGRTSVAEGPVTLAAIARDGRVFEVRVDGDYLEGFEFVGLLPGDVAVADFEDGIAAYGLTADGRLFRARVAGGSAVVESLGDVIVEDTTGNYELTSAVVDPNDPSRVLATLVSLAIDNDGDGYPEHDPFFPESVVEARLEREPITAVAPASFGVGYGDVGGAYAVCWPPSDEPFADANWTLQLRPATVLGPGGPGGNCAVVLPDDVIDPMFAGAERALVADVPGVGRVRLGFEAGVLGDGFDRLAGTTADGGAVDVRGVRVDAIGLQVDVEPTGLSSSSINWGWHRDMSGDGLYEYYTWTTDAWPVASSTELPTADATWGFAGWVASGGAIWASTVEARWVVARGAAFADVPAAQREAVASWYQRVLLDDGRICGVASGGAIGCADAGGAVAQVPAGAVYYSVEAALWPLGDGTFVVSEADGGASRFDPDAMTVTPYDDRWLSGFVTAADGAVYGIATVSEGYGNRAVVIELAPTGAVDVVEAGTNTTMAAVVPLAEQLFVYSGTAWSRVLR